MDPKPSLPDVRMESSDMPRELLEEAVSVSHTGLRKFRQDVDVAHSIKCHFDQKHGSVWNCVVGKNFGVFVTHQANHFAHFYIGKKAVVLFKGM